MSTRVCAGSFTIAQLGLFLTSLALPTPVLAAIEALPIVGEVYMVPNSTNTYVTLKGKGALQMYKAMSAKPIKDACREGRTLKSAGNLYCSLAKDGKSADCNFGLNTKTGTASVGQPC
jgi:hypothetical protein